MSTEIQGSVKLGFEPVKEAFAANFSRKDNYRELGASLAVYMNGNLVVDLHGGWRDADRKVPWTQDTLANIWSATKGVVAIEVAALVDQGKLDYNAPVTDYWPEYGQNGKEGTTVSHIMSHQAGLPGLEEATTLEDFYDWDVIVDRLARQAPMWKPGTKNSYHAMTYGFLAGELIRRASGLSVGQFLAQEISGPLDANVFIGLPQSEEHRVALLLPSTQQASLNPNDIAETEPVMPPPEAIIAVTNPQMEPTLPNARAWRAAEIPAGNGHASALGIAKLYAVLANGGTHEGVRLMGPNTIAALSELQTDRDDILLGEPAYWRQGLTGNIGNMYGPLDTTIGHSGWGGSFGCFDPVNKVAIGYVLNQMGDKTVGDPRCDTICHAVHSCL